MKWNCIEHAMSHDFNRMKEPTVKRFSAFRRCFVLISSSGSSVTVLDKCKAESDGCSRFAAMLCFPKI